MGYASRARGTYEERKAKAIERDEAIRAERDHRKQEEWNALPTEQRSQKVKFAAMMLGTLAAMPTKWRY